MFTSFVTIAFLLTTVLTLVLFYVVLRKSTLETTRRSAIYIVVGLLFWLVIQAILALKNTYNKNLDSIPPKIFLVGILPTFFFLVAIFLSKGGKRFVDSLPLYSLTFLHSVRIPVEIVLYWLFLEKTIPELMTFQGRNFDIIAGLTAPFVAYFGFVKKIIPTKILLLWNIICLVLLLNIVVNAFLSAPSPMQRFAFEQPNVAILNFPIIWLPTFIVPIVLFSHLVAFRQLLKTNF
jgi:hypothetical protein